MAHSTEPFILIVEDDPDLLVYQRDLAYEMLSTFRSLLESRGHEVAVFRTASAAWLWLEQVKARSDSSCP